MLRNETCWNLIKIGEVLGEENIKIKENYRLENALRKCNTGLVENKAF